MKLSKLTKLAMIPIIFGSLTNCSDKANNKSQEKIQTKKEIREYDLTGIIVEESIQTCKHDIAKNPEEHVYYHTIQWDGDRYSNFVAGYNIFNKGDSAKLRIRCKTSLKEFKEECSTKNLEDTRLLEVYSFPDTFTVSRVWHISKPQIISYEKLGNDGYILDNSNNSANLKDPEGLLIKYNKLRKEIK